MFLLEKNSYGKVEPMFEKMLDYETTVIWALKSNNAPCQIYVDNLTNPQSCYIQVSWGACYFGGKYNEQFVEACIKQKFTKPKMYCIFSDIEILKKIDENMPVKCEYRHGITLGAQLYYKLSTEKFLSNGLSFKELPGNYELILNTEKENEKVILMYNGKEAGHCDGGYSQEDVSINLDVFLEEEHRNRGIGPLVCAKLIDYHLSQNHHDIAWGCFGINVPSAKCAEKLGFEKIHEGDVIFCFT
ncbi:MAG: GNAT family N-acetyltransferase [Oscillospiraceae bacterium]|nr:GNAT family N-acetyltransferase [Oscillospiraceae bacterium]